MQLHRQNLSLLAGVLARAGLLALAALGACAEVSSPPPTVSLPPVEATAASAPSVAAPPAPSAPLAAAAPSAGPTTELTVRLDRLGNEKGKIVYDADGDRMAAHHDVYELDPAELRAALGARTGMKRATLLLRCGAPTTSTFEGDPNGARPLGGFVYETRACAIVKLISAE
jgi:hypothetical protein